MELDGHVACVTGGSSGIGRGIATRLADAGASISIGDVQRSPKEIKHGERESDQPTDKLIQEDGGEAIYRQTDVSDPEQCSELIEATINEYGQLDVLVNNAGISTPENAEELSIEEWQRIIDVNLSGAFYCVKYALPYLRDTEGTIINIGSVQAEHGGSGPPYAASKAGLVNLTRELATEYGDEGIRVNAICPGAVRTANWNYLDEADLDGARKQTLLPRFGEPRDIGDAAVFLASDRAEWVTGEAFFVDGGWSAHR
jgi:NAD(P)-dependent dehydrogenase (short-subunit alcohol dehydrogenase family)